MTGEEADPKGFALLFYGGFFLKKYAHLVDIYNVRFLDKYRREMT